MIGYLRPGAVGAGDSWTLGAGGSKVIASDSLDPIAHDGDTTYLSTDGQFAQLFTVLAGSIPAMETLTSISFFIRCRAVALNVDPQPMVRLGGVNTIGTAQNISTSYVDFGEALARPGGGGWAIGDITTALEIGVRYANAINSGSTVRCTSVWAEVNYAPVGGGFAIFVAQWLGPIVALGLHEMPRVAADLARLSGTVITPEEYGLAFREIGSARWPSFFFGA